MSDKFTMSVGLAHELEMAFGRTGWSATEVKSLTEGKTLADIRLLAKIGEQVLRGCSLRQLLCRGDIKKVDSTLHVSMTCICRVTSSIEVFESWAKSLKEYFEAKTLVLHRPKSDVLKVVEINPGMIGYISSIDPHAGDWCRICPVIKGIDMSWEFD